MDRRNLYRRGPGTGRKIKSSNQTKYLIRHSLFALAEPENIRDKDRWRRMIFWWPVWDPHAGCEQTLNRDDDDDDDDDYVMFVSWPGH